LVLLTLSPRDFEILRLKCIWATLFRPVNEICAFNISGSRPWPRVYETSLVARPHDSLYSTSCKCFITTDTNLKFEALTILQLLAVYAQKILWGHVTLTRVVSWEITLISCGIFPDISGTIRVLFRKMFAEIFQQLVT